MGRNQLKGLYYSGIKEEKIYNITCMLLLKEIIKIFIRKIINIRRVYKRKIFIKKEYGSLSNKELFTKIYNNKIWDLESKLKFSSGPGSHDIGVVNPYVQKIVQFLYREQNLTVVDLGCGDFNVGSKIYKHSKNYIAVDVVEQLIKRNRKRYNAENLTFFSKDIVNEKIPKGNCILIKEVFQHLTNPEIKSILTKIKNFKYIFLTESRPFTITRTNIDKIKGPDCRTDLKSCVVIDDAPFYFKFKSKKEILRIKRKDRYIITILYET